MSPPRLGWGLSVGEREASKQARQRREIESSRSQSARRPLAGRGHNDLLPKAERTMMGLGNLFSKTASDGRPKKIVKLEKKITNMYIQPGDRQYFLEQLRQDGSEAAATALLKRFGCSCENHTIDRDEKELTYRLLVEMGTASIPALMHYLRTFDNAVNWPFKALRDLISQEKLVDFLVEILEKIGPDYVRDPEKKEQLILTAKEFHDERLARAVVPYLDDDNETIRFITAEVVITFGAQGFDFVRRPLLERFVAETSPRTIAHIVEAFVEHEWKVDEDEEIEAAIPEGYRVIRDRTLKKR